MDQGFNTALAQWKKVGLLDRVEDKNSKNPPFKYLNRTSEDLAIADLSEYYWNHTFATS